MKRIIICLIISTMVSGCISSKNEQENALTIVKDHKANAVIVIPEKAPFMTKYAARELKTYIKKISGAEIPIKTSPSKDKINIYVGGNISYDSKKVLEELAPDSYKVVSGLNTLALYGRDYNGTPQSAPCHPFRIQQTYNKKLNLSKYGETGTLFAVYDLLRQLGVRWYMPGELGEVVPVKADLSVSQQDKTVSPDYSYRFLYFNDAANDPEGMLWFKRLGLGAPKPIFFNHTIQWLQKKLRTTHPEYFAIVDGERDLTNTCMGVGSLKLTNPKVIKCTADFARENLDKNKTLYLFPICLPDGYKRIDDADKNKIDWDKDISASLSEYVWDFMNKVAKDVYKTHPDRKLGNIAYQRWQAPPEKIDKLAPNMEVMICRSGNNCSGRSSYYDARDRARMRKYFDQWTKKTNKVYAWDYYLFWHKNSDLTGAPIFFTKIIDDDLKYLKGKIEGEFIEGSKTYIGKRKCLASPGMQHLNLYVTARLYWDADQDLNTLIKDYSKKFYGPAAHDMRNFFETAEKIWMRKQQRKPFIELYTMKDLSCLQRILNNALKAVEKSDNPKYSQRIKLIKNELSFFINTCKLKLGEIPCVNSEKISDEVTLDGDDNEKFWKNTHVLLLNNMKSGRRPKVKTEVKIVNNEKNLFIYVKCQEPLMTELKEVRRKRDGFIWKDETLELFLMPKNKKEYFQIALNQSGSIWDGKWQLGSKKTKAGFKAAKWDCKVKTKVKRNADSWNVEISLPLHEILSSGEKPESLYINVMRSRSLAEGVEYFALSPTFKARIHDTTRFAQLILSK